MRSTVRAVLMSLLFISPFLGACSTTTVFHNPYATSDLSVAENLSMDEGLRLEKLPPHELISLGRNYLSRGNLPLARLHFLVALKNDPNSAAAYTGVAEVHTREGNVKGAETAFESALQRLPGYPPAQLGLGRLRREAGDTEGALKILMEAKQDHSENMEILSELAITLDRDGRFKEAEPLHRLATERLPNLASAHNNLGFHYLLRERYGDSVIALQRAVHLDSRSSAARNNLAVAYVLNNETEKALALFRGTIGDAAAWNNIGYLFMTQGKRQLAGKAFLRALDLNPKFYQTAKRNLDSLTQTAESDQALKTNVQ